VTIELPVEGASAPPRDNGEVVFDAPWQSRAFGLGAALVDRQQMSWADFQAGLIEQVRIADEQGADTGSPDIYWRCWLETLGGLAAGLGLISDRDWSDRAREFADRPVGHDH
jgi:nitrile hydratase accessory protein